jgi:hypothetical protein
LKKKISKNKRMKFKNKKTKVQKEKAKTKKKTQVCGPKLCLLRPKGPNAKVL